MSVVTGTNADDVLHGTAGDDTLQGLWNYDWLVGSAGHDRLDGGTEIDLVMYDTLPGAVVADLGAGHAVKASGGTDTLIGIENIHGTAFADRLTLSATGGYALGRAGADTLTGAAGRDQFLPGSGNDSIDGRDGYDWLDYRDDGYDSAGASARGVTINVFTGTATDNWGGTDRFANIEEFRGTDAADAMLAGGTLGHLFIRFFARGGDDTIDGGGNLNVELAYQAAPGAVLVDLAAGTARDGQGGTDVLLNLRRVQGGDFADSITGDATANILSGGGGDDLVAGGAGGDTLRGAEGRDTLLGQDGDDLLAGDAGDDRAEGGAGRDSLFGDTGDDTLLGGGGDGLLAAGAGQDSVQGGDGLDSLLVAAARRMAGLSLSGSDAQGAVGEVSGAFGTTRFSGIDSLAFIDGRLALAAGDVALQVTRLYQVAFDRAPDPFGLNHWIDQINAGTTLGQVAAGFAASGEFAARFGGLDQTAFITQLHANATDRQPSGAELTGWVSQLQGGMSRADALLGIAETAETQAHVASLHPGGVWDQDGGTASIARLYQATLDRRPDAAGLAGWRAEMEAGKSLLELTPGFLGSIEFNALYGSTGNAQFITLLYNNVLDRAPDAAGLNGWLDQLNSGALTRGQVVLGFSESLEFRLSTMSWIEGGILFA